MRCCRRARAWGHRRCGTCRTWLVPKSDRGKPRPSARGERVVAPPPDKEPQDPLCGAAVDFRGARRSHDYAGATGRIELPRVRRLSAARYVLQPKLDGAYVRVHLDRRGRVSAIYTRTGRQLGPELVGDLLGAFIGWPHSQLIAELDAWTDRADAEVARRGYRRLHLFDAVRSGTRYLGHESYATRRDHLRRMRAEVEELGRDKPWLIDDQGHAHDPRDGRYVRGAPKGWRLAPVVEQYPLTAADDLWQRAEDGELEGFVAVALDAPIGKRGAKRKCKPVHTLDAVVEQVDGRRCVLRERGTERIFACGCPPDLEPGAVVEVGYELRGFGKPRFPRILRRRPDLMAGDVASA